MKKIVNARSDGAAVLTGKNSGVWTKINPYFSLFSVAHDGAHKVNLISNEVLAKVEQFKLCDNVISLINQFYT